MIQEIAQEITSGPEFYNQSYASLCQEYGQAFADDKVQMYQELSRQHRNCSTWLIHNCQLLTSYSTIEQVRPAPTMSVFYAPIKNTEKQKHLSLHQVADLIRSNTFEPSTKHLRTITDKKANRTYKATAFCYATFSGTFTKRADANLIQHSGLICIDMDHLNERLPEVRAGIIEDPGTVMSFISPNGDGLKVIYEMDPGELTQEQYYKAYSARLRKLFNLTPASIDNSCKDVSRACFLPHDPEIFINPYFVR